MEKAVITVVGKDKVGIIAAVCNYLAKVNINILDISQTITHDYFNMMMVVSLDDMTHDFGQLNKEMEELGKEIGVVISIQHENIFDSMHRI
ncbi:MAG: ACT domain-containing protein [Erysipelotrichaceae bacterium]